MPQENMEVVLRANAAANGGDYAGAAAAWHPDTELRDLAHAVDTEQAVKGRGPGVRGRTSIRRKLSKPWGCRSRRPPG
jgi:hypothetical protein